MHLINTHTHVTSSSPSQFRIFTSDPIDSQHPNAPTRHQTAITFRHGTALLTRRETESKAFKPSVQIHLKKMSANNTKQDLLVMTAPHPLRPAIQSYKLKMQPIQFLRKDITVFTSAIFQTTTTLLQTPNAIFLIDPNWLPHEIVRIKEYLESVRKDRRLYLVFTHSDYDHIIGYGAFPDARVIASEAFARKKDKEKDVHEAVDWDNQHYVYRDYPILYPRVDIVIDKDGNAMHFDGTVLTFYFAPGHTKEGMYLIFEPAGAWIAGDYLSDVEIPLIEDSLDAYRRTMAKTDRILRAHQINWLVPGHGTVTDSRDEILRRRDHATEYLDDLEHAIKTNGPFPANKYRQRYPFWNSLQKAHSNQLLRWSGSKGQPTSV